MSHKGTKTLAKWKEVILRVIAMYKDHRLLWDHEHEDYLNRALKNRANEALLEVFKEYDPNATVKTMSTKICNLRTNYRQELRKVKDSKRFGTGKLYAPSIWYYKAFQFMEDYYDTASSDDDSTHTEDKTQPRPLDANTDRSSKVILPPRKKKRRRRAFSISPFQEKEPEIPQVLLVQEPLQHTPHREQRDHTEHIEPTSSLKEQDWEVLGKSLGIQLRDLNPRQLTITQKIISDAIYNGKLGLLTEKSSIDLGPSKPPAPSTTIVYPF